MRVYETPSCKRICDMSLDELDSGQIVFKDIDSIFDIIRDNCGDEFTDDFRKLMDDFLYFNSEWAIEESTSLYESDIDYAAELERLEQLERNMYAIRKTARMLQQRIALMNLNKSSSFSKIQSDIDDIVSLSNS